MPACHECGASLDANVRFCPRCGALKGQFGKTRALRCPSCGLFNPPGSAECDCGFIFDAATYAAAETAYKAVGLRNIWKGAAILSLGIAGMVALVAAAVETRHVPWHGFMLIWSVLVVAGAALVAKGVRRRWPRD